MRAIQADKDTALKRMLAYSAKTKVDDLTDE
jgi:hypothetical protein